MADFKLTKSELRTQQRRLSQLEKYLPTLQLKKAMLQLEVLDARLEIERYQMRIDQLVADTSTYAGLLTQRTVIDPIQASTVSEVDKIYENIAGVEVPRLQSITFEPLTYNLFDTPAWVDGVIRGLRGVAEAAVQVNVAKEKKAALEHELRQVSIRVNLFEKVLIPRSKDNIKTIKVFLGDQELSAVGRAKVAKGKIEARRQLEEASRVQHAH